MFTFCIVIDIVPAPSEESVSAAMDEPVQQDDDDCPELVPIETDKQIPVTIITGYLGTIRQDYYCCVVEDVFVIYV